MSKKILGIVLLSLIALSFSSLFAAATEDDDSYRLMDISKWHDVGNIWLRVSNYGFFGSGSNSPQWPSLEYPGGSGIDYLFQGALWFGAKKVRRDIQDRRMFWEPDPESSDDVVAEGSSRYEELIAEHGSLDIVIDTLVTVGFDGDASLYEFLPAYNPLERNAIGLKYGEYNLLDRVVTQSIRTQRAGEDDDGDGLIDEDPVGRAFPFREAHELPPSPPGDIDLPLANLAARYLHEHDPIMQTMVIEANLDIWFPLGFIDLGKDPSDGLFNYTAPYDDDSDGLIDEDGSPVSEQDYFSYYYDYSPFGTSGKRNHGISSGQFDHFPLGLKVRQLSYQWSYEYIKNLVYVEFNITNMNPQDTLYDCAMAIYMDCDVGPQAWSGDDRSLDDVSGYVAGSGYEFAYTRDYDGDGGLSPGWIGARVCSPDPEELDFACWVWQRGDGPDDRRPRTLNPTGQATANEKYWLITGRNPDEDKFSPLRPVNWTPDQNPHYEEPEPNDTRFLFAFYGDMQGMYDPTPASWNLAPGRTMKIVVAVFPGEDLEELKDTAVWAKDIYGEAQTLETVILPDIHPHYLAPEPPTIPKMYAELADNGNRIDVYWDNRSEFTIDRMVVSTDRIGWQNIQPDNDEDKHFQYFDSHLSNFPGPGMTADDWPEEFRPPEDPDQFNANAIVNPWTGYRLRHDFQGYTLWGRSGSGRQDDWTTMEMWDKIDTDQDFLDYEIGKVPDAGLHEDFGGYLGVDKGLPNLQEANEYDTNYYYLDEMYIISPIEEGQEFYGLYLYNYETEVSIGGNEYDLNNPDDLKAIYYDTPLTFEERALLFKHPNVADEVYLELYGDSFIPLPEHAGQSVLFVADAEDAIADLRRERLARRYYRESINHPPKGVEYYVAVTAWDRGMPGRNLERLESGRDADANMKVLFPGPLAQDNMDNIYVVPNPYFGLSKFDGRREGDMQGDRSKRIWFVNLPERATIKIYTLAGDLVDEIEHYGTKEEDIITVSRAARQGLTASGIASWNVLSRYNQVIAPGVYLYSVKDHATGDIKVDKFVIIQ